MSYTRCKKKCPFVNYEPHLYLLVFSSLWLQKDNILCIPLILMGTHLTFLAAIAAQEAVVSVSSLVRPIV